MYTITSVNWHFTASDITEVIHDDSYNIIVVFDESSEYLRLNKNSQLYSLFSKDFPEFLLNIKDEADKLPF